jgi:hypothetical protein
MSGQFRESLRKEDKMVVDESSKGNASLDNVEMFDFEGHKVAVREVDGVLQVENPELEGQALADWQRKADERLKPLVASLNKKNLDAKKGLSELDLRAKELELKQKELELREREIGAIKHKEDSSPYKAYWGVDSAEELQDLSVTDPLAYAKGMALMTVEQSNAHLNATLSAQTVEQQISLEGNSPADVRAFMRDHNIGDINAAYRLYKQLTTGVVNPSSNVRRAVQDRAPEFLPSGSITTKPTKEDSVTNEWKQAFGVKK